jgi:hypothetical protein
MILYFFENLNFYNSNQFNYFCLNLFSNLVFIPWGYLQRIDYLAYEINFMLKETAQVVSFGTSGLTDEKAEELKKAISDMVEINAQNNSHV